MPDPSSYTRSLTREQAGKLELLVKKLNLEPSERPYTLFAAKGKNFNLSCYQKGPKVLIQGKGTADFVRFHLEPEIIGAAELGYEEENHPDWFSDHLGIDESGKGDFFGPLVIAAAYTNKEIVHELMEIGVTDSKKIGTDKKIAELADRIRKVDGFTCEVLSISPIRYNQLYDEFQNLNHLLAWGHSTVIERLLEKKPDCPRALSDQFANPKVLQSRLGTLGKGITLEQRTKAESDPAVAAASILARHHFVTWLKDTSEELNLDLPKGAASHVVEAGKKIALSGGKDALEKVAKMHFKTANEALSALE